MAAAAVTSAAPLLALLEEEDDKLKVHALKQLDGVVAQFWYQISNYIPQVEALCEDTDFTHRESASLLASKVFYYLRELDEALNYALGAGSHFDINDQSEYVSTIIARALDKYFDLRQARDKAAANGTAEAPIDVRLEAIVERMITRCCSDRQFQQAIGVCLEARRLDKLEEVIVLSEATCASLRYALRATAVVVSKSFREQALRLIVRMYEEFGDITAEDWVAVCQCLMMLGDVDKVAETLARMLESGTERRVLLAFQIAFDLFDNDTQAFMQRVQGKLDVAKSAAALRCASETSGAAVGTVVPAGGDAPPAVVDLYDKISTIISGTWPVHLQLEFLYYHNHADLQLLKNIKDSFDTRVSMCHSATVMANAFMHAGTTVDSFLRQNLEWLTHATNWAKFGATASLGVIHRGHLNQTVELMAPYLPGEGRTVSPYSEGGALYALGLIHASHGRPITEFITTSLRNSSHEVVQHGACLGLGLAAQGTQDDGIYEELKEVLYTDSAVAGEAAGLAMGLLCCGAEGDAGDKRAEEMLAYAHDTQHEKIIRGLAIGLAVLCYGREEAADVVIEALTADGDPLLRYGGMYAVGLAYRGTDNNGAIQKLLHFAVSDVADDVRRAAVTNLGFVLLNVPAQCPQIVSLLAESYNPHLRYGAAMAVGIACAGTGLKVAEALLKPMLKDRVDFVRQGANIAMALVMVQQPEAQVSDFRKHLEGVYTNKHEDVMCKLGAIMAAGILDAGGRNVTIGMTSSSGYYRRTAIVAVALFTQYWFWFPMSYMLSLSFKSTALIGVTADLKLPKFEVSCTCKRGLFAYAKPVTESANKKVSKLPTAILSTTKKAKERAKRKAEAKAGGDGMDVDAAETPKKGGAEKTPVDGEDKAADEGSAKDKAAEDKAAAEAKEKEEKAEAEQCPYKIENPARVTPAQAKHVAFDPESRFQPLKPNATSGILVLLDKTPAEPVDYVEKQTMTGAPQPPTEAVTAGAGEAAAAPRAAAAAEPEAPDDMAYED